MTIHYFALPLAHGNAAIVAYWPDGRLAVGTAHTNDKGEYVAVWCPLPTPDAATLWPEPAPVADAKPAVRWLNRSTWWCDDCQAAHGAEIPICFCGTRRPTPTP